jgi:putative endopeptidase
MNRKNCWLFSLILLCAWPATAQNQPAKDSSHQPVLPYCPSLDLTSIDRSVNPCVDFYHYACGNWQRNNPIPNDQTSWDVYQKLYQDNLNFLRGILEQAAAAESPRDPVTREVGDFYSACMDEATVERRGLSAIQPDLDAVARLKTTREMAPLLARLQLVYGRSALFDSGSQQDFDDSEQEIADIDQGGLGLPDRDYYTNQDDKSKEKRQRYLEHVQKIFTLMGDTPESAATNAATVMRMETALAVVSQTRVERRDPYNLKHKMNLADLGKLAPNFDWQAYFREAAYPDFAVLNVASPNFFKEVNARLADEPLENWKTYLRFELVNSASPYLSSAFADESFAFYRQYLRGAKEQQPRWKRCVAYTDRELGEALGQAYVARAFSPDLKRSTVTMVKQIEDAMAERIQQLDWMSAETKLQALAKLQGIRNKIGYPDAWRDYSSVRLLRDDFIGDMQRATLFESRRQILKIGKPVDHAEWEMSPPTVNAYFDPTMNDINFPAGVLQPPLYDAKMDAAPNYGDTGGTVGHELTHGFDDQGSQFDAHGNLRNWWTPQDRQKFDERTSCVRDQYAQYVVVDEVHINSKLTLGEDVADLGGEILAYLAWKVDTKDQNLQPVDGLTPDQRFFIGFAQWACANERPEDLRERAITNPHSPAIYRVNGVVVNMPEFSRAFSCKAGDPMTKPSTKICRIW